MFPGAKIIAVDDERDQLEAIVSTLRSLGLACIAYNYPIDVPQTETAFSGIRVIFLDIKLIGGNSPGGSAAIFNAPLSMIERLISDQNGPYALITWSSTSLHDQLMDRVARSKALAQKQPFYSCALSKAEFSQDAGRLKSEVENIFKHSPPFGALLDWERRVSRAGEAVLKEVHSLSSGYPGGTAGEKMDSMLSRLAVGAFGKAHAAQHCFEAVNEALLPILGDALITQFFSEPPTAVWNEAVTSCDANLPLDQSARAKLNSAFLLECSDQIKPYRRGAVLKVPDDWMPDKQFRMRFGATREEIYEEIFAFSSEVDVQWVLVQKQAACDFAQPKIGPIPYVLAALVPATATSPKKHPAYIFKTPILSAHPSFGKDDFAIWVLNNVPFGISKQSLARKGFRTIGRIKEPLLESLVHEHHGHGSRPGFIRFD